MSTWIAQCWRCQRVLGSQRRYLAHLRRPCDQDTPEGRRAAARSDAAPQRPARGRKLMMRPQPTVDRDD